MAANLEYQVLTKIIETQNLDAVQRLKIDESYFFSPEARMVFTYIWNHAHATQTRGQVPSFDIVQSVFKGFPYSPSNDAIETLCEQIRLAKMRSELLDAAERINDMANYDPRSGMEFVNSLASTLNNKHEITNDLMLSNIYDDLYRQYELVASNKGVTGYPWPWEILNEATQGMHSGEFIVMYGRPKSMKTWIALYIIAYLNIVANLRILIHSAEMPGIQILRRIAALQTGIDYRKLVAGQLQPEQRYAFFWYLHSLKEKINGFEGKAPIVVTSETDGGVSYLKSKARDFKPHVILVDGMYLMRDDRTKSTKMDWKNVAHISQDLKKMAKELNIPVVGVGQAKRSADKSAQNADLSEIAYSDALAQDCDLSIRVQKRIDEGTKEPEVALAFPGARETDLDAFLINARPAIDFSLKSRYVQETQSNEGNQTSGGTKKKDNGHMNDTDGTAMVNFRPRTVG